MKKRIAACAVFTIATLVGCGKDSETTTTTNRTYQAAGSRWSMTFTDSTFSLQKFESISDTTADMTVSGSVEQNSTNLFKTMRVSTASGTGAPSAGATAFALEIPGSSTFIVPFGESNPLVATVVSSCPSANFTANWVVTKPQLDGGLYVPSSLDDDGVGTATFNQSASTFTVNQYSPVNGAGPGSSPSVFSGFNMSSCSSGRYPVSQSGENFDMYFTPTGQIVVKFPAAMGEQIISGLPQTSAAVTASSLDGTYSVLVYRGGEHRNLTQETVVPANLTLSSGSGSLTEIITIASNTEASSAMFTVNGFSASNASAVALPNGMFRFNLSGGSVGDGNGKLTCATTDGTPKVIACFGYYNVATDTGKPTGSDDLRRPITILGRIR